MICVNEPISYISNLECVLGILTDMWNLWDDAFASIRVSVVFVYRVLDGGACSWPSKGERAWIL